MKITFTVFFIALSLGLQAQEIKATYYKDLEFTKPADEKNARYKKTETLTDSIQNVRIYAIEGNCLLRDEYYTGKIPTGIWTTRTNNCQEEKKRDFARLTYSSVVIDSVFQNVIKEGNPENYEVARFGDSENAIYKYLMENIRYPEEARESGITGVVYLQFLVLPEGYIKMVSVLRGLNPYLDYEAWRVLSRMPRWNPAKKNGQPVYSVYNMPIRFSLK